ncbi:hypothetical protein WOLCODRAFT_158048 [Wolfiporia cocos MD-104 SS10]|uniref:Uncharacterized protein n=1 Tax=Wolfiporia cocos (strain MD-104) TaxID=742152 RepID=A0A2H3J553_WOLCO|nr:hypothetical protein WOLCODRAFT_158048 [Wolfiporia cocos MD-104 SS10]
MSSTSSTISVDTMAAHMVAAFRAAPKIRKGEAYDLWETQMMDMMAQYAVKFLHNKTKKGQGLPLLVASIMAEYCEANDNGRSFDTKKVRINDKRIKTDSQVSSVVEDRPIPEIKHLGEDQWWIKGDVTMDEAGSTKEESDDEEGNGSKSCGPVAEVATVEVVRGAKVAVVAELVQVAELPAAMPRAPRTCP